MSKTAEAVRAREAAKHPVRPKPVRRKPPKPAE